MYKSATELCSQSLSFPPVDAGSVTVASGLPLAYDVYVTGGTTLVVTLV